MLVDDPPLAVDHEGFRHAIDPPFNTGPARQILPDLRVRIAQLIKELFGLIGRVFVVEPPCYSKIKKPVN